MADQSIGIEGYKANGDTDASGRQTYSKMVALSDRLDPVNDTITAKDFRYNVTVISTATTTTVMNGPGIVHAMMVLGGTLGSVTAYDNTAASGNTVVPAVTPTQAQWLMDTEGVTTGLTVVTAAATLVKVIWSY